MFSILAENKFNVYDLPSLQVLYELNQLPDKMNQNEMKLITRFRKPYKHRQRLLSFDEACFVLKIERIE